MARRYDRTAEKKVAQSMHEYKRGRLKSGRKGTKVTSRSQAIAIGLAQARRAGGKVPKAPKPPRKTRRSPPFVAQ